MNNLYQDLILDEAKHPSNQGQLKNPDKIITEFNASCGDSVIIEIKIKNNKILDLKWRGTGCIISMAATSVLSRKLIGLEIKKIKKLNKNNLLKLLNLENISPGRLKCLLLSLRAIQKAL